MISPTAEYALRAVVYLGCRPDEPHTNAAIAEATKVPTAYLPKVLQLLGRAGLVRGQRGVGGGYSLAWELDDITLKDVVEAVDPIARIHTCPLEIASHGSGLCPLHRKLDDVMATVERMLEEVTVGELVRSKRGACRGPVPLDL